MIRIKICGNKRIEDMYAASKLGAHAVGFIFNIPESPRNNNFEEANKLVSQAPPLIDVVAVTTLSNINETLKLGTKSIQIIGDIKEVLNLKKDFPFINFMPVLYVSNDIIENEVLKICSEFKAIVVDTKAEHTLGGSGKVHDWNVSRKISKELGNVILAGGLNESNVIEAITKVEPYGVDVSSGVELSPGVKDYLKLKRFIEVVTKYG